MLIKICKRNIFIFLSFFLMTIGNSRFLSIILGDKVELLGLVLLGGICVFSKLNYVSIKRTFLCLLLSLIMSSGAYIQNNTVNVWFQIFIISFLLTVYAIKSDNVLFTNDRIRSAANGIFIGCICSIMLGFLTNTIEIFIGFDYSIVGVLFNSGFLVKNYCGAAWLMAFILYYIYYYRTDSSRIKNHKAIFSTIFMFILLSGSKGAVLFCLLFFMLMNIEVFTKIKKSQRKIFYSLVFLGMLTVGMYIYTNILSNITTYAYRMRGLSKIIEIIFSDIKNLFFGISNIAYANTGYDYTTNMRNFLGWEASVEMAYVNILIKFGLIGLAVYIIIFLFYIKNCKILIPSDKKIIITLLLLAILSGFVEAYISTIHYIMGPTLFCLIYGIMCDNKKMTGMARRRK